MLINIVPPLTESQTRALLSFCVSSGVNLFTVNFLYVKGEESETCSQAFYERLAPYCAERRVLENIEGDGFREQQCWEFSDASMNALLRETDGNVFAYNVLYLPEDWVFYVGDSILLQIVSHEQEATLRLTNAQYDTFKALGIPHGEGCPQWSGLPERPIRTNISR